MDEKIDLGRLARAIYHARRFTLLSKKTFWKDVAQQYYGELRVNQKKIDLLRLAWRRNEGGIREKLSSCGLKKDRPSSDEKMFESALASENHTTEFDAKDEEESINDVFLHSSCDSDLRRTTDANQQHSITNDEAVTDGQTDGQITCRSDMAEFLGCVIGSTISTIYNRHFIKHKAHDHQPEHFEDNKQMQKNKCEKTKH